MLAKTFSAMIIISFFSAILTGNVDRMAFEFSDSLTKAVSLCIALLGMMSFWSGVMNVLREAGAMKYISKALKPVIKLIYGRSCTESDTLDCLSASVAANFLGLGNAALPLGINAVKALQKNSKYKDRANDASIMFAVLNTVPFQLLPSTLIALRSKHGCLNPYDVVPYIWLSSAVITVFAIVLCKLMSKLRRN